MSDSGEFYAGMMIGAAIIGASWYHHNETPPPIGKYQIIDHGAATSFLLDTTTGQTWQYVYTHIDEKTGKPDVWEWSPVLNFSPGMFRQ